MSSAKPPAPKPDKPSKETVYIDVEDDITTIIGKVEAAKEKIVALVLPKRSTVLQSTVNMRLLKRGAEHAGKNLVLVTSDSAITPLAGAAGLHVAKNLQSRPVVPGQDQLDDAPESEEDLPTTLDHHRAVGELAAASALDEPEVIDMDGAEDAEPTKAAKAPKKDKKLKVPDFDKFRLRLLLLAAGGLALIVLLVLAIFVFPKATVKVKTGSVDVSANFSLTTSKDADNLDPQKKIIPASEQTKDQTVEESVPATGERNDGEKASGQVTFSAQRCAPNIGTPSDIPAGTGLSTGGLTYISQSDASFSYDSASGSCVTYKSSSVNITAQEAGSKYNVSGASFSVQGHSASASGSASGGTDKITKVVSQADLDKVRQKITAQSSDEFSQAFLKELDGQGLYAVDETLKLSEPKVSSTPKLGEPASTVKVTAKVNYRVLAVKKDDLSKAVFEELNKQMDTSKQKLAVDDVLEGIVIDVSNQKNATTMTLEISQTVAAIPIINEAEVRALAAGQKTSTIVNSINELPGVEEVEVKMSPFYVSVAPKKHSRITVVQEQLPQVEPEQNNENDPAETSSEQNP